MDARYTQSHMHVSDNSDSCSILVLSDTDSEMESDDQDYYCPPFTVGEGAHSTGRCDGTSSVVMLAVATESGCTNASERAVPSEDETDIMEDAPPTQRDSDCSDARDETRNHPSPGMAVEVSMSAAAVDPPPTAVMSAIVPPPPIALEVTPASSGTTGTHQYDVERVTEAAIALASVGSAGYDPTSEISAPQPFGPKWCSLSPDIPMETMDADQPAEINNVAETTEHVVSATDMPTDVDSSDAHAPTDTSPITEAWLDMIVRRLQQTPPDMCEEHHGRKLNQAQLKYIRTCLQQQSNGVVYKTWLANRRRWKNKFASKKSRQTLRDLRQLASYIPKHQRLHLAEDAKIPDRDAAKLHEDLAASIHRERRANTEIAALKEELALLRRNTTSRGVDHDDKLARVTELKNTWRRKYRNCKAKLDALRKRHAQCVSRKNQSRVDQRAHAPKD